MNSPLEKIRQTDLNSEHDKPTIVDPSLPLQSQQAFMHRYIKKNNDRHYAKNLRRTHLYRFRCISFVAF